MRRRNSAPPKAKGRIINPEIVTDFTAIRCLYAGLAPSVSPLNSGMRDTGSTTKRNTTKNLTSCSTITLCTAK